MKILHLCPYYITGYAYQENSLPLQQQKLGNEVAIITSTEKYFDYQSEVKKIDYYDQGVKIIPLKPIFYKQQNSSVIFNFKKLLKKIEKENPDIIHVHGEKNLMVFSAIKYKKKNPRTKIFIDCHADFANSPGIKSKKGKFIFQNKIFKFIYKKHIYKYIEGYMPINKGSFNYLKYFLKDIIEDKKIKILPLGADKIELSTSKKLETREKIRKELGIEKNKIVFFNSGKLYKKGKNIDELILAFDNLNKKHFNIKLLLIGILDDEIKSLLKKVNNKNIILLEHQKSEKLKEFYIAGDIGVWPSASNSNLEAMACGRTLVLKYSDTLSELINQNGYFYNGIEKLEEKMESFIKDRSLISEFGRNSLKHFENNYSWGKIAKDTVEEYLK